MGRDGDAAGTGAAASATGDSGAGAAAQIGRTEQEASIARARRGCEMRRARGLRGDVGDDEGDIRPPESQADGGVMQSSGGVLAVGEKPIQRTLRRGGRAAGVPNIEDSAGITTAPEDRG